MTRKSMNEIAGIAFWKRPHIQRAAALVVTLSAFAFLSHAQTSDRVLAGRLPPLPQSLELKGDLSAETPVNFTLVLKLRDEAGLDQQLRAMYDPANPQFRHFLTTEEFQTQHGPTADDYQAIVKFAKAHHLTIQEASKNRLLVHVTAKAADVQRTFKVHLHQYVERASGKFRYGVGENPTIASSLPLASVVGLYDYPDSPTPKPQFKPMPQPHLMPHQPPQDSPTGPFGGLDFRAAYAPGVVSNGAGQVVGVILLNDYLPSDIAQYETNEGIPQVPLKNIVIPGLPVGPVDPTSCESPLDISQVVAMAPGLKQINVYEGSSPSATAAVKILNEILAPTLGEPTPGQVTTSYSLSYASGALYPLIKGLASKGIGFFAASGDHGGFTSTNESWPPTDDGLVTAVGGTVLTTSSNGAWAAEVGWPSSSGGQSTWGLAGDPEFIIPIWQFELHNLASVGGSTTVRNIPDVAAIAQNVRIVCQSTIGTVDGDSAATPLWAAFEALANETAAASKKLPLGNINSSLYAIARTSHTALHDITSGSNGPFQAAVGYDLVTGLGSPNGTSLIDALVSLATPQFNCAAEKELISNLQQALQTAENNAQNSQLCQGPASLLCKKNIQSIQTQLGAEGKIYAANCK